MFNSVVSSTVLYGCETWTLKLDQQRRLRSAQRRMLRMVLNARRMTLEATSSQSQEGDDGAEDNMLEPWPDFLKRTARWTEEQLSKAGQSEWIQTWRRRQWKWACRLVTDDAEKWSFIATIWQPRLHSSQPCGRTQSRPRKRWDQDIIDFLAHEYPDNGDVWLLQAKNKGPWMANIEKFVEYACASL